MNPSQPQHGFAIVSAIFLVVILAALGAFMASLSATSHSASSLDVQGARAYQAARAGIEWAAWQGLQNAAAYACATTGASTDTLSFSGDLAGFTTTVQCSSRRFDEAGNDVRVYELTATATYGVPQTAGYVARVVTATVARCTTPGGGAC